MVVYIYSDNREVIGGSVKKTIIFLFVFIVYLLTATLVFAETRYNPYTNKYEVASKEEVLTYNSYENTYEYAYPDSEQEYNPYTNKYEVASKEEILTYNPYENTYEYAYPGNKWEYNPYERKYESSR